LAITTDNDLPGSPVAVLNVPDLISEGIQVEFDAVGSNGGDGNITEIYWDFGDEGGNVTYDPATVVYHTYLETGTYNVSIEVHNDLERVGFASEEVQVESYDYVQDLLIIYNSDMPEDLDLVNYYSSPTTGRGIDPDYRLGLPLGAEAGVEISITTFETDILPPIKAFLDDVANAEIKANIKYLLLMKGVPYKIKGENEFDIYLSTHSTVDSELCCLYSYGEYETTSFLWNQRTYEGFTSDESQSFFLTSDDDFVPDAYLASDIAGTTYPVNYLVGRLSAYNYDEAKLLVDRSLSADTSGQGWIILDSKPSIAARDTMVEPVWPLTDPTPNANWPSAYTLLSDAGLNVYLDTTDTKVTSETEDLPAGVTEIGVIGYDSHGKHSGFHEEYILNLLGFDYLPGACFMSIESFNCYDLDDTDGSIDRNGQGLIGDFFRMGGTVAIGTAWEPYVRGVGDERWVFDRYLHYGDIWIEAAYKGMRCLSWQEVVLGDPLCRVVAE